MKLTSIIGKGTGKLGGSVFVVSEGRQIVREYQPNVRNPRTEGQQVQRTKFAGLVLLAREFAPSLMYLGRRAGVSERNEFVRRNSATGAAAVDLSQKAQFTVSDYQVLRLTSGVLPVNVEATGVTNNKLAVGGTCPLDYDVVKIDVYERVTDALATMAGDYDHFVLNGSAIVKATGGVFSGNVDVRAAASAELVIVAVAMKSNEGSEFLAGAIFDGFGDGTSFDAIMSKKEIAAAISEVSAAGFATYTVQ